MLLFSFSTDTVTIATTLAWLQTARLLSPEEVQYGAVDPLSQDGALQSAGDELATQQANPEREQTRVGARQGVVNQDSV